MSDTAEPLLRRHWATANDRDWTSFAALLQEDMVYQLPQTRERVRGKAGYLDVFRTWPGPWRVELTQVIADAGQGVTRLDFLVGGDRMTGISFFTLRDGLIAEVTDYWPEPYEPPPRVSAFFERY